jgi:hypothetical protein
LIVETVRKRKGTTGKTFNFNEETLQMKGFVLALALTLRLDIALLIDFLPKQKAPGITVDLQCNRDTFSTMTAILWTGLSNP